ncbi:hypothetical protein CRG98_026104 [Punica granatum]|uniref:DDE Tnp4 domain-containing protein n=1 Tax=Punica granatum TaxID=22663 RepID=A0A2I0JB93_PUNGR|nr:hypothetical protein CRG98_026104 [Punica granatum]
MHLNIMEDWPTLNVFAACDFDLKFTYVLPGWEGTASDSRILKDAVTREDSLNIPEDELIPELDAELENQSQHQNECRGTRNDREDEIEGELIRDAIAANVWNDYVL